MALWLVAPAAVEADLLSRNIDIGWWHRNTLNDEGFPRLSSRRLINLINSLDDDSAYRTALRDGNWSPRMQMLKKLHNSTVLYHASKYENPEDVTVYLDPVEAMEKAKEKAEEEQAHEEAEEELMADLGWT